MTIKLFHVVQEAGGQRRQWLVLAEDEERARIKAQEHLGTMGGLWTVERKDQGGMWELPAN